MRFLARPRAEWRGHYPAARACCPGSTSPVRSRRFVAGVILGFVNAIVRPVLFFLTLPLTLITLGLFIFVLNAICFALTAWLVPGFSVDGFWWAIFGALLVSIVSWILNGIVVGKKERD